MRILLYVLPFYLFIFVVTATPSDLEEWEAFKAKYGKTYKTEAEEMTRMEIFLKNKHKIDDHNENHAKGLTTFEMGLNEYSDLSSSEIRKQLKVLRNPDLLTSAHVGNETGDSDDYYVGYPHHHHRHHHHKHHRPHHHHKHRHHRQHHLPTSIDWRTEGAVNRFVPSQGQCGACWAFSVAAAIEGQYFRKTGKLVPLSVQNLVDCSHGRNEGCAGGYLDDAFEYVRDNGGINTAASYPYEDSTGVCRYEPRHSNAKISGFKRIPRGNEDILQEALATIGPISVSMDASSSNFDFYKSGIYTDPYCRSSSYLLDHSVLLVGYGSNEKGEEYYILKNWYGPNWGEHGYFKLARNRRNHCGVATEPMFPIL